MKSAGKEKVVTTPKNSRKNIFNPEPLSPCSHKKNVTCKLCEEKPSKIKSIALLKETSPSKPP